MIYLVEKATDKIINKCDAWLADGEKKMIQCAHNMGLKVIDTQITFMGDMVIYVG